MGANKRRRKNPEDACPWQTFLDTHGDAFLLYARHLTRTESDAKDILQQVMMDLWRSENGAIPDKPLVFLKLRQKAIDLGRSKDRRVIRERKFAAREENWFNPSFGDAEIAEKLQDALKELPEKLREVILLRVWGDLPFSDIAATTGVGVPTASARFRYGIERLRKNNIINELSV